MKLSQLMQVAADREMARIERDGEYEPYALAATQFDDTVEVIKFDTPTKTLARVKLAEALAQGRHHACVVVLETWSTKLMRNVPEHVRIQRALEMDIIRISQLPAELRSEALVLIGEDATGATADRMWEITREPGGPQFELINEDAVEMNTPWRPMFMENTPWLKSQRN